MTNNTKKNIFKSIVTTDRYGIRYVKNFSIMADGAITLQRWDDNNHKVKHIWLNRNDFHNR